MKEVQEYALQNIPTDKIIFDETNPNEMSEEQEQALDLAMRKFGFLAPVILQDKNKKGEYKCIDGEHRIKKYLTYGKKQINAYVLDVSKVDAKILRQVMNKLRGQHDKKKDADEFSIIDVRGKLNVLASLIARPREMLELDVKPEVVEKFKEGAQVHNEETFLHGNVKQMYFVFDNATYEDVLVRVERIMKEKKFKNHTQMFMELLKVYEEGKIT